VKYPRQITDESELYATAIRILMRRGHSVHQMRVALERRCEDGALVGTVMARLKQKKLVDDARFAAEFARLHAVQRKQGRFRIARELRTRGVPDRHIETALETVFAETDESAILRKRIEKKLHLSRGPLDEKKRASLYRNLMAAGFNSDAIRRELKNVLKADVDELPQIDPELED
jgi:regulatory protein